MEGADKILLKFLIRELKSTELFTDFTLMENHGIVPKILEFKPFQRTDDISNVVLFMENAES